MSLQKRPATLQDYPVSPDVRNFLESLMEAAGMNIVPPEIRHNMLLELAALFDTKMTIEAIINMNKKSQETLIKMVEDGRNQKEINEFVVNNLADVNAVFEAVCQDFRRDYPARN